MYAPDSRSPHITLGRWALCLLSAWLCLSFCVQPAQAAVIISSFTAAWAEDNVNVEWETASELDTAGFYVQRSDSQNGVYIRITEFFIAEGDDFSGASYLFIDSNVTSGNTYWYKLETIDLDQESEYYGPISAVPSTPSLTPTATSPSATSTTPTTPFTPSPTVAVTPTVTQAQPLPSATRLPPTAYPFPATATRPPAQPTTAPLQPTQPLLPTPVVPTATEVISPSTILSTTATLIPLPEITLTFPAGGIVIQKHGTATITPAPTRQAAGVSGWNPAGGVMLISIIVLIWILLGVWFYMSFRRIE
jgi:hypothetical protein